MQEFNHSRVFLFLLVAASVLAACGGTLPGPAISARAPKADANLVAFTGVVEAIHGTEWTVSGQKLTLDPQAALDPEIVVGDEVKVEANVLANGAVVVLKVESSVREEVVPTTASDASSTAQPVSTSTPQVSTLPVGSSTPDPILPQMGSVSQMEVSGILEARTANTLTVNGVTYSLASSTEFKDMVGVGDQVRVHVTVNADGTFTVREVEKSLGTSNDNSNSDDNSNSSSSDDDPGDDANDDHSNNSKDDSHHDSDDHGDDDGHGGSDDHGPDDD